MQILVVEDEPRIAQNLQIFLEQHGYRVTVAPTSQAALELLDTTTFTAAIVDWMLPDRPGTWLCRQLRARASRLPLILLTAKSSLDDKVTGFAAGADDYLTKPFELTELLVRLKALIRRAHAGHQSPLITLGSLIIDTNRCQTNLNRHPLTLSPKEYSLLEYLALHPETVCSRLELMEQIWGDNLDEFSNTVDVHIRYLRRKLGPAASLIKTVKNKGYMLCPA